MIRIPFDVRDPIRARRRLLFQRAQQSLCGCRFEIIDWDS
jgi:hypothetical protein